MEDPIISGIAFNRDEAEVNILGVPDMPGIAYQILGPIAEAKMRYPYHLVVTRITRQLIMLLLQRNVGFNRHKS